MAPAASHGRDRVRRALEELLQPVTAVYARAEVVDSMLERGEMADVPYQLNAMRASAERLIQQIDVMCRVLADDPVESNVIELSGDRPVRIGAAAP
jgi:hypothetical protein